MILVALAVEQVCDKRCVPDAALPTGGGVEQRALDVGHGARHHRLVVRDLHRKCLVRIHLSAGITHFMNRHYATSTVAGHPAQGLLHRVWRGTASKAMVTLVALLPNLHRAAQIGNSIAKSQYQSLWLNRGTSA